MWHARGEEEVFGFWFVKQVSRLLGRIGGEMGANMKIDGL
jgi:hypothetical protein